LNVDDDKHPNHGQMQTRGLGLNSTIERTQTLFFCTNIVKY